MPTNLTPKQESFCLAYLESGNASAAYRLSYGAAAMQPSTIHRAAKALLDNHKIAARLAELRGTAAARAELTLTSHLAALAAIRDKATSGGQFGAAVSAEIARGKAAGLYEPKPSTVQIDPGPNWRALFRDSPIDD